MKRWFAALVVVLSVIAASCGGSGQAAAKADGKGRPAAAVRVSRVVRRDVGYELKAIGNVEAWSTVAVKSRVAGQLLKVHVRDGSEVKEGDSLFEIDPLPFLESVRGAEAAVARDVAAEKQAQAAIARAAAQAANARTQAKRYEALFREGIGAREQMDQYVSAAEAQEAQLNAERAALESSRAALRVDEARLAEAKLQLSYTKIAAPASGRVGFVGIRAGNLVRENDTTPLVTIVQLQPVWAAFAAPERHLNEIRRAAQGSRLPVQAMDEAGTARGAGTLDVIDNSVDTTTGTIKLKARFENRERTLWPGQFVNLSLHLRTDKGVLTVPGEALQDGPDGRYVWVMKDGGAASMRPVEVARSEGGMAVISKGLVEGETVVTFGQLGVREGTPLRVLEADGAGGGPAGR